ncbi:MAG: AAA family ATPase [Candidatus Omnitrophica bacterium]|nr:AAA family ATPase [Candidatus Omnitrophota bacterium]
MYFKKLEIFGFKSFAERTVLNFEPGITAIVGPNGCGKSNVFDSVRWVLGEQSAKQLRGSGMEDVIFNGTDTKLALGFAEVSVTFDNASRTLPINADEVVITRRLFRSGESEYLINKEVVRLRDVSELFMGTGVGAEAYSLVQQGKVDLVVSAKPEDRRMIFDEASGITKYKAKKREAQSKLQDTEQNLLRLNDIVVEIKRQIASIERQAQKAQRYKAEFERLKGMEILLASWQLAMADKERDEVVRALEEIRSREGRFAEEIAEYRQVAERESVLLEDLEIKVREVREQELKLENQLELGNRQIGFNEERLKNLSDNEARLGEQRTVLIEKCRLHQDKISETERSIATLLESAGQSLMTLEQKRSELAQAVALIEEYKASIRCDEERILQMSSRQSEIRNQLTENMKEEQGLLARRRRLDMERAKVVSEREVVEQKLRGLSEGILAIMARRQLLNDDLAREKTTLASHNEELAQLSSRIDELEKKKLFLVSQKDFIEKLQVQYQDIPDPVIAGRFLSAVPPTEKQSGIIGKVKSVAALEPSRLESLKQHLAGLEGDGLYEVVCETKFIELDPQVMSAQIEAIAVEVSELVARREKKIADIAEQSRLVERIFQDIHVEDKHLSVSEAKQNDIGAEAGKLFQEFEAVRLEIEDADRTLASLVESKASWQNELQGVEAEIGFAQEEIQGRQLAIQESNRAREEAAVAVAQTEAELSGLRDKESGWRANVEMFQADLNGYLDEISRCDQETSSFNERREKLLQEIETVRLSNELLVQERSGLKEAFVRHEAERQDVDQRLSSVRSQIGAMERDIAGNRDSVHEREMRLQQIVFHEQSIKERMLQRYQVDMSLPVAAIAPVAAADAAGENVTPEAAPVSGRVAVPVDFDPDAMSQEIQTLTKRCESFGAVNLVAIDEFEDLRNRFQFLTKQQSDLLTAKDSLEQTIRKINKTTRQLFVDTFTKVNEQFRLYFRMLFNGGEAQLILVDPENALESGIEIVARPPGKKLQTISLLSGGEKTMTAIAMIFSVFRVNPSPFCVLDEIDAALDEANVDRFASVLKEFAKIAQFIVITHNKKTIANADVMYGVTMQQTGVSRVVSVKLSDKSSRPDVAPAGQPEATTGGVLEADLAVSQNAGTGEVGQEALVAV